MLARQEGSNHSQLCERYGISRKTGYKWLSRAQESGWEALEDRSRRPRQVPRQSPPFLEDAVLAVRDAHPVWGGRKIARVLERDQQVSVAPGTVTHILHRHGRIEASGSEAAQPWIRFEHASPNELWQMDFKGHFAMLAGRCHPLTVLDDHSRFNLVLQACANEQRLTVQQHLQACFERYGLPRRIQADNGNPWGDSGQGSLTQLGVWLIRLGIRLSHSRPAHPQSNGKDERFHRTLKAEVLKQRIFADLDEVQAALDRWRFVYNHERPHESLSLLTPAERYQPSPVSFPSSLPPIEYLHGDLIRKVQQCGRVHFQGKVLRVSRALVGHPVALRPHPGEEDCFDVFFCHQRVASVDLSGI